MKGIIPFIIVIIFLIHLGNVLLAQMVGSNAYLQGHYLEIGLCGNGAFGACASPAGYHPHPGPALGEVYDVGHDGWTVGTTAYMGDYTFPGSPFEGWELQIASGRVQGFQACAGTYGTGGSTSLGLTGAVTSYSNIGGSAKAIWTGTALGGQLIMNMETRVDTEASWVIMTVRMNNTGATPLNDIYFLRSCDPDNKQTWSGGSFNTDNVITYQNDILHRVQVSVTAITDTSAYLGLCTKDTRATAFIYAAYPLASAQDLSVIWAMTYPGATYTLGEHRIGDIAIGLVFNIGTIAPGDSATFSYAYTFNGVSGIDSTGILATSVSNLSQGQLQIFPNPTTDELIIQSTNQLISQFTITNSIGQQLLQQPITGTQTKVNVSSLPAGLYYINLKGDNGSYVRKFVKL